MVGVIAGWLEKNGKAKKNKHVVGAVGGISIPPVNHYIAGYKWAAKMEDPSVNVLVGYSNNFTDPAKCKGQAQTQIGQGADVIFQVAGGCGLGALQAAGQSGIYSIGVDADQKDADASVIASALKKVDVATYTAIKNVVNNQFSAGALTFSIANDGAGYAPDNLTIPAELKAELDKVQKAIHDGTMTPPADIPASPQPRGRPPSRGQGAGRRHGLHRKRDQVRPPALADLAAHGAGRRHAGRRVVGRHTWRVEGHRRRARRGYHDHAQLRRAVAAALPHDPRPTAARPRHLALSADRRRCAARHASAVGQQPHH